MLTDFTQSCQTLSGAPARAASRIVAQVGNTGAGHVLLTIGGAAAQPVNSSRLIAAGRSMLINFCISSSQFIILFDLRGRLGQLRLVLAGRVEYVSHIGKNSEFYDDSYADPEILS